jgi:hypothetical protein
MFIWVRMRFPSPLALPERMNCDWHVTPASATDEAESAITATPSVPTDAATRANHWNDFMME